MITYGIIFLLIAIVKGLFFILPTLPVTPAEVITSGQWVIDQIVGTVSFLRMLFSTPLLIAIMVVVVGMHTYPIVYHGIMWILKKIPMLNIK